MGFEESIMHMFSDDDILLESNVNLKELDIRKFNLPGTKNYMNH